MELDVEKFPMYMLPKEKRNPGVIYPEQVHIPYVLERPFWLSQQDWEQQKERIARNTLWRL